MARILLIDDDPNAREMLRFRLQKDKHDVIEAEDGDKGWDLALRRPDLIILDIRIPKIDGLELCRQLKKDERTWRIPILMLTGCAQPVQESYGYSCGADAYITKPWDPEELMKLIRKLLQPKPQPGA